MPLLRETKPHPRPDAQMVVAKVLASHAFNPQEAALFGFGAIPMVRFVLPKNTAKTAANGGSEPCIVVAGSSAQGPSTRGPSAPAMPSSSSAGGSRIVVAASDPVSDRPLKKRLRPRKKN